MKRHRTSRAGFSLIEVTLALLVVALGMLALFSLFPSGLREGDNALMDTHVALFGEYVMASLHANALKIDRWNDWDKIAAFRGKVVNQVDVGGTQIQHTGGAASAPLEFPYQSATYVRYKLTIGETGTPERRKALLWVSSGQYGFHDEQWFYSEFFYSGTK